MSHFTVTVMLDKKTPVCLIKNALERAMYPFQQLDMTQEDAKADERSEFRAVMTQEDLEADYETYKETCKKVNRENTYKDVNAYLEDYHNFSYDEEKEIYGFYTNPKDQWDWYTIGGRWAGSWKQKKGTKIIGRNLSKYGVFDNRMEFDTDVIRIKNIDYKALESGRRKGHEKLWKEAQKKIAKAKNDKEKTSLWWEYGIKDGTTKEEYCNSNADIATFATIDLNGNWHEKDDEATYKKKLEEVDPETILVIVDCHV